MLKSFYHTGFVVRDLEKSVSFYQEVMGMKLSSQSESSGEITEKVLGFPGVHLKVAFLSLDNGHTLELMHYIVPPGQESHVNRNDLGATHLAFFVDDIEDFYAYTSKKGMRFINPPASRYEEGKLVLKALYAQDPDNNWLEFVEVFK